MSYALLNNKSSWSSAWISSANKSWQEQHFSRCRQTWETYWEEDVFIRKLSLGQATSSFVLKGIKCSKIKKDPWLLAMVEFYQVAGDDNMANTQVPDVSLLFSWYSQIEWSLIFLWALTRKKNKNVCVQRSTSTCIFQTHSFSFWIWYLNNLNVHLLLSVTLPL